MTEAEKFYQLRNDRSLRYAGRVINPSVQIAISADPEYLASRTGQAAVIVAANLLARMSPRVAITFDDTPLLLPLIPSQSRSLQEYILEEMRGADPFGLFETRQLLAADYRIHFGSNGADWVAHASGWNVYIGPAPSPIRSSTENIFSGAFAAVAAIARVFANSLPEQLSAATANLLSWGSELCTSDLQISTDKRLGDIWFIGAGSVGSAIAYFLALAGLEFEATVFDADPVKIENLDRSPIFCERDVRDPKAEVVSRFLMSRGIAAHAECAWLDQSEQWKKRQQGTPDIFVSAANERNVRYTIETQFPPVQVYGTTGTNWQAAVLRHLPPQDPCSCCIFPPAASASTRCATGSMLVRQASGEKTQVDAALPFLSFAAGLMAAVEIAKLSIPRYEGPNRGFFTPCAEQLVYSRGMQHRGGCLCVDRNTTVHSKMISGSNYASLCKF